ncbi:MAG: tellurite resistance TerB family protein [Rhodobacteraceae bacterium]|nr:tellurite resistance TerB family protein [Paracoccaceae bacterium]
MGLFSNLRSAVGAAPSPAESNARAVLTVALLTAAADGKIEEIEFHQIVNMCTYSPIFHAVGPKRTMELAQEVLADLRKTGAEACFASAKAVMTARLAETAMCFAVRTALADGSVDQSEIQTLSAMGERLGLPFATFEKIFDIMVMMQRPA